MPLSPKKCCGKNVKLTPRNITQNCLFNRVGFKGMLKAKGNQWVTPAIIAKTAPIDRT